MSKDWENKKERFDHIDVRAVTGNFLPGLLNRAGQIEAGNGCPSGNVWREKSGTKRDASG